jgi:hypothetical protein
VIEAVIKDTVGCARGCRQENLPAGNSGAKGGGHDRLPFVLSDLDAFTRVAPNNT